jgi:glutathione S-transferase
MLAATQERWENAGLEKAKAFSALKADGRLLFGQVPMLEIDGLELVQSQAIIRYLARKHSLSGSTPRVSVCGACCGRCFGEQMPTRGCH